MNISVIIPNYNGESLLEKNVPRAVGALSSYSQGTVEIIIADDASTDSSVSVIKKLIDKYSDKRMLIRLVTQEKNKGFSGNVNAAVKDARGDILLLLNTDVIPHKGFLEPLISHFSDPKVFAVGCMDESIEDGKTVLRGRGLGMWRRGFLIHSAGSVDKQNTLWVSCGSGAFRKSMWDNLGGLNELYNPFYWEDIDLSYRAQKAGFTVLFEPKSRVIHEHEAGVIKSQQKESRIKRIAYRNQFFFVWLNITDPSLLFNHLCWLPVYLLKALFHADKEFLSGFFLAKIKLPQIVFQREKNKKLIILSDKNVIALNTR